MFVKLRYGPPPSYPNLKISGLNAPIPDGCRYPRYSDMFCDDDCVPREKQKFNVILSALATTLEVGESPL